MGIFPPHTRPPNGGCWSFLSWAMRFAGSRLHRPVTPALAEPAPISAACLYPSGALGICKANYFDRWAHLRGRIHTCRYPKRGGGLLNRYVPSYCGTPPFSHLGLYVGAPGCVPRTLGSHVPTIHACVRRPSPSVQHTCARPRARPRAQLDSPSTATLLCCPYSVAPQVGAANERETRYAHARPTQVRGLRPALHALAVRARGPGGGG